MNRTLIAAALLTIVSTGASAQTALTYRFQADTLAGRVWVSGEHARQEIESGEGGTAAGRVAIWRDGGRQIFILNPGDRTYYEDNAYRAKRALGRAAVTTLTAGPPFSVERVGSVQVNVKALRAEVMAGFSCRRAILTFSYTLTLRLPATNARVPGRVEGTQDFCLADRPGTPPLPFGHHVVFASGHPDVDAAIAAELAELRGIPVARLLTVTRRIENGEPVSATSALLVSDIQQVTIVPGSFEVPRDYRFREPEIVPPVRRRR